MAAPEGNQFWKIRSKHGRDKLFSTSDVLWEAACEYFEWCDENPWVETKTKTKAISVGEEKTEAELDESTSAPNARPYTITGLCIYLGCNTQYLNHFKSNLSEDEQDFSIVITRIEETIYTQKFEGAAVGAFNANIIARDLGLKDESKQEHTGPGGGPIQTTTAINFIPVSKKGKE